MEKLVVQGSVRNIYPSDDLDKLSRGLDDKKLIQEKIFKATSDFKEWSRRDFEYRAKRIRVFANLLEEHKIELAELITSEVGKIISESIQEIEKSIQLCHYFAEHSEQMLADEFVKTKARESYVSFEPLGVVLAVMPWNFPVWQVLRLSVPAIMAGNAILLKSASNVMRCSLKLQEYFSKALFPSSVFTTLAIEVCDLEYVVADERIKAIALTGSDKAGSSLASLAGKHLKKINLELGGSDPLVVFPDADIRRSASEAFKSRLRNCGQTCTAPKRMFVAREVYDEFLDYQIQLLNKVRLGNPLDANVDCGPMAKEEVLDNLDRQIRESVNMGAEIVAQVSNIPTAGNFFPPTIMTSVTSKMPIFQEETFGPVWVIMPFDSEEELLSLVNDSNYGLAASIWTEDMKKAKRLAKEMEVGSVFINSVTSTVSELPFGGVKRSGYGRELSSYGIKEFVNIKTFWIN